MIPKDLEEQLKLYIALGGNSMIFHSELNSKRYNRDHPDVAKRQDEIRLFFLNEKMALERKIYAWMLFGE